MTHRSFSQGSSSAISLWWNQTYGAPDSTGPSNALEPAISFEGCEALEWLEARSWGFSWIFYDFLVIIDWMFLDVLGLGIRFLGYCTTKLGCQVQMQIPPQPPACCMHRCQDDSDLKGWNATCAGGKSMPLTLYIKDLCIDHNYIQLPQ
jgi:hypothetical protein